VTSHHSRIEIVEPKSKGTPPIMGMPNFESSGRLDKPLGVEVMFLKRTKRMKVGITTIVIRNAVSIAIKQRRRG
tara:strand:- start:1521 stop:1742 length:222 start_codon:yes stop_codon:yes gene_type:complete